jgi:hypothetical protein
VRIDQTNSTIAIDENHATRRGFDRQTKSLFRPVPFGNFDERNDDPIDLVVHRAIWPHAHQVPALIGGTNFPIQRRPVIEHRMRIIDETLIT